MSRRIVGPFNRVEGDLEVQLSIEDGMVTDAWVVSSLYRGFEQILQGKDPMDALVYVPRICGICSVSQSVAAANALANIQGLKSPPNGEIATNLILANENITDHLTHFYLFFMPDFARNVYQNESWFPAAEVRFKAIKGTACKEMLPVRAEFLHLMGLLAGKWPHSLAIQPGGTTRSIEIQEKSRILAILFSFRQFLQQILFGDQLENIIALDSADALTNWLERPESSRSDFGHFLHIADALNLETLGRAGDHFMSYGVYPEQGNPLFARGTWNGTYAELDHSLIREDISHSWMKFQNEPKHPFDGVTIPSANAPDGYTWCKAPRLNGQVMEVGALARQVVNGHPLIRDLVSQNGSNVRDRVIARLLEIALVVPVMEDWAKELTPKDPFCLHAKIPDEVEGFGMMEAARGSLGHWLKVKNGRILNYQIIAPTTWNFSPRDADGVPGALEQALINTPLLGDRNGDRNKDEKMPVEVQHIVRSFDPCMVCTVH